MSKYIWQFQQSNSTNSPPTLVPVGSNGGLATVVNIVNDFFWTNSKLAAGGSGRSEVPSIFLTERKVKTNSYIAQALYSAGVAVDSVQALQTLFSNNNTAGVSQVATATNNTVSEILNTQKGQSVVGGIAQGLSSSSTMIGGSSVQPSTVQQYITNVLNAVQDDPDFLKDPWLAAYKGLYITEKTGWVYLLPFFSNKYQTTSNTWNEGESGSGGSAIISGISNWTTELSELGRSFTTMFNVGSYQEKSKFYQYSKDGDSISVSFPLINTASATYTDILRNWQFIYMLLYQNRPERVNRLVVSPPPIYEVEIPGVRYMPLSYISSLDVEYLGSRRSMAITIPGLPPFSTIIPEAFQINITLTSLVGESKNFLYAAANRSNQISVLNSTQAGITPANIATSTGITNIANTLV